MSAPKATLTLRQRLATAELVIPCRHGWYGPHCIRDNEGKCPFTSTSSAECRCNEAARIDGIDSIRYYVNEKAER